MRHVSRADFNCRCPGHVTLKLRPGLPSLRTRRFVREFQRTGAALRARRTDFRLIHYSIQRDHLHAIVEAADADALGRGMKALAARFARAVNRVCCRTGRVLRDRYHLHVLRTPREVRNAIRYVLLNVRKHSRRSWPNRRDPASSGRWFDGWRKPLPAAAPGQARGSPVAAPRTWLLRLGWRRHGLIDTNEVPSR